MLYFVLFGLLTLLLLFATFYFNSLLFVVLTTVSLFTTDYMLLKAIFNFDHETTVIHPPLVSGILVMFIFFTLGFIFVLSELGEDLNYYFRRCSNYRMALRKSEDVIRDFFDRQIKIL